MSVDEIIDALGGTSVVAALAGVGLSAVSNWRSRGRIPSGKFMIFFDALEKLGQKPSPELFDFETAEARP